MEHNPLKFFKDLFIQKLEREEEKERNLFIHCFTAWIHTLAVVGPVQSQRSDDWHPTTWAITTISQSLHQQETIEKPQPDIQPRYSAAGHQGLNSVSPLG